MGVQRAINGQLITWEVIVYGFLVKFVIRMPIKTFLKGIFEPWLVAFTTCSSAAALPANLKAARKLGATKSIASFSIPLGNTVHMNGTAPDEAAEAGVGQNLGIVGDGEKAIGGGGVFCKG